MNAPAQPPRNPAALSPADVARLLSLASRREVTEAMVGDDLAAGAPTNPDGTVNLMHYAAWLVRQQAEDPARGDRPPQAQTR
ncbi:MAG TPA: hypothetical protein VEB22_02515 [Phycisphaerales bacterium]|nr:hypothetical protein [Phycisphaerales bacterium]